MKRQPLQQRLPAFFSNIYAVLLPVLLSLSVSRTGYLEVSPVKFAAFYWSSGIYLGLLAALGIFSLVRSLLQKKRPGRLPRLTVLQIAALSYLAFSVLSAVLSPYGTEVWTGFGRWGGAAQIIVSCLCLVCVSFFARPNRWMAYAFGGAILLYGVICVWQVCGGNPLGLYPDGARFGTSAQAAKFLGTTGSITLGAAFLCMAIPVLFVCALRMKQRLRFVLLLPAALALFVLYKMNVQAGILGLAGGMLASVFVAFPMRRRLRRHLLLFAAGLALAAVLTVFLFDIGSGSLHELHEMMHGRFEDSFGTSRVYIWRNVLQRLPEKLPFGAGPDTLRFSDIPPFTRYDPVMQEELVTIIADAHCEPLNILYNQGVFSLLSYLVMLGAGFAGWVRNGRAKPAVAALGAAAACYAVQSLFGISDNVTTPCFLILLGLLDAACREDSQRSKVLLA